MTIRTRSRATCSNAYETSMHNIVVTEAIRQTSSACRAKEQHERLARQRSDIRTKHTHEAGVGVLGK